MSKQADWKTRQQTEHVLPVTELTTNATRDSIITNNYTYI